MAAAPYGSVTWLMEDVSFHVSIAKATRNAYLVQLLNFVAERVRESILASSGKRSDEMAQATISEHERIRVAIEARDSRVAAEAMRTHLENAAARVGLRIHPMRQP
jgi:GntR family transcriptional repressor for pyruvate dehydrogenase complex